VTIHIHPSADVSTQAQIGEGCRIWHHAQIREGVQVGKNCIIGKGVYLDVGVKVGDNVKVQNYVSVYHGVTLEDGVFVGPHVCFTNDLFPRAINPEGSIKAVDDWVLVETRICRGASLGANSTIVCGVTIGEWALVGAGSVIAHDVPAHGLAWGNPGRLRGFVCMCGRRYLVKSSMPDPDNPLNILVRCKTCGRTSSIPFANWEQIR
jgi:UDP-2-acetamido-3-amino-2,3-dideoxy-glucuronate N-acetyltransferase